MRKALVAGLLWVSVAQAAQERSDKLVTRGQANKSGSGVLCIASDRRASSQEVADVLADNLNLSSLEARIQSIEVDKGVAKVDYSEASPGSKIEGRVPAEIASKYKLEDCETASAAAGSLCEGPVATAGCVLLGAGVIGLVTTGGLGTFGSTTYLFPHPTVPPPGPVPGPPPGVPPGPPSGVPPGPPVSGFR